MSLRHSPTIDELLGDSLIQAVMRADHAEPQGLRRLLTDAAFRVAEARVGQRPAGKPPAKSPIERRAAPGGSAPKRARAAPPADPCGSALCC